MLVVGLLWGLHGCGGGSTSPGPESSGATSTPLETIVVGGAGDATERYYDGVVEAVQQATLTAQTAGRIAATLRDVNDSVRGGELLLRLTGIEQRAGLQRAEQARREAEARAAVAAADFDRVQQIYAQRLVSKSALDRATADRDAATAQLAAARAGVAMARETVAYTEVRAPFAGVITRRLVEPGEAVAAGQALLAMAALDRMRVVADLPSSVADAVRGDGRATVLLGGRRLAATQVLVFPAASSGSSTVRVRVDLPSGAPGAYPGLYAKVAFAAAARAVTPARIFVPDSALIERSEVTAVYVVGSDGMVVLRQVRPGRRLGTEVEVLAGLAAGERVAVDPSAAAARTIARRGRATDPAK